MFPTETNDCWRIEGIATFVICERIVHENRGAFSLFSPIFLSLMMRAATARMLLTPWQMNVAHATPSTPIPNAVTKSMSAPIFAVDDIARNINGVRLSPIAVNIPVAML